MYSISWVSAVGPAYAGGLERNKFSFERFPCFVYLLDMFGDKLAPLGAKPVTTRDTRPTTTIESRKTRFICPRRINETLSIFFRAKSKSNRRRRFLMYCPLWDPKRCSGSALNGLLRNAKESASDITDNPKDSVG